MIKSWRRKIAKIGTACMILTLAFLFVAGVFVSHSSLKTEQNKALSLNLNIDGQRQVSVNISDSTDDSEIQTWLTELLTIVIPALGLAGTVVPAVYNAGNRKVKGILIQDMTRYFFPCYGIIMLENLALTLVGQACCAVGQTEPLKYFFIGSVLSVVYASALVLGTGLSEKLTEFYVKGYISDKIDELAVVKQSECSSKQNSEQVEQFITKRSKFLAALSRHIAEKAADTESPFFITDEALVEEIRQIIKVITYQRRDENRELETSYGFTDSFDAIFRYADIEKDSNAICESIYYRLPASKCVRNDFSEQIGYAYEFWQNVLNPFPNIGQEAKTACRILYAMNFQKGKLNENYVVIGCGLIVYLYKKYHSSSNDHQVREVEQCAMFIDQMTYVFRSEFQYSSEDTISLHDTLKLCTDLIFTVWVIALIEEYSAHSSHDSPQLYEAVDRLILGESGYFAVSAHTWDYVSKYVSLSWNLIKQLPTIANKAWTMEQKRKLLAYVKQQLNFYQDRGSAL